MASWKICIRSYMPKYIDLGDAKSKLLNTDVARGNRKHIV